MDPRRKRVLGARLDSLASEGIAVLHDRPIPGSKANVDHIAITRTGIWVIDAKRYKGRPELKIEGGILRPRGEKILVGPRDCTKSTASSFWMKLLTARWTWHQCESPWRRCLAA